jgi:hypothetical protein
MWRQRGPVFADADSALCCSRTSGQTKCKSLTDRCPRRAEAGLIGLLVRPAGRHRCGHGESNHRWVARRNAKQWALGSDSSALRSEQGHTSAPIHRRVFLTAWSAKTPRSTAIIGDRSRQQSLEQVRPKAGGDGRIGTRSRFVRARSGHAVAKGLGQAGSRRSDETFVLWSDASTRRPDA